MPKRKSDNPRDQQLLVRLSHAEKQVLAAAASLDQVTLSTLVRGLAVAAAKRLEEDPLVQRQLSLWDEQALRRGGQVVPIGDARRQTRSSTE